MQDYMDQQFQFHKGTIRTLKIVIKVLIYALFQFHKGTIRTPYLSPTPFFPFFISIP